MRRAHVLQRANKLFCASFTPRAAACVASPPVSLAADCALSAPSVDCVGFRGLANWARGGVAAFSGRCPPPDTSRCSGTRQQQSEQQLTWRGDQRCTLFGIPGNDDLTKQYKERRLVGCVQSSCNAAATLLCSSCIVLIDLTCLCMSHISSLTLTPDPDPRSFFLQSLAYPHAADNELDASRPTVGFDPARVAPAVPGTRRISSSRLSPTSNTTASSCRGASNRSSSSATVRIASTRSWRLASRCSLNGEAALRFSYTAPA